MTSTTRAGKRVVRFWTPAEDAVLLANYNSLSLKSLAERFGRSVPSVNHRRLVLGIRQKCPWVDWTEAMDATLRRLHAAGFSDVEIGAELGIGYGSVRVRRKKLGLEAFYSERQRAKMTASVHRNWKVAGVDCQFDLPPDMSIREFQILLALLFHGPATRLQLAERIGMTAHTQQKSLLKAAGSGGTYTAKLITRGLVCYSRSEGGGKGPRCRKPGLYMLTLRAVEILSRPRTENAHGG